MAGKRQHFVPRFLQQAFSSRLDGDTLLTYVYRKGKSPFETSTRHVGVGNYFYSKSNDSFLDDLITEAEQQKYSGLVRQLRIDGDLGSVETQHIAEMMAHIL